MLFQMLATGVLFVHMAFILFVAFGGLAVFRWPRLALAHLPALFWGICIEIGGWTCPLTYLENALRQRSGEPGIGASFIDHYLLPIIYPPGLSATTQWLMALALVMLNVGIYTVVAKRANSRP
jgi:Protein of Unknown function (DUF2784)